MKRILKKIVVTILTWEARLALRKYKPKVVAISGNVGKTGTKDAIFTALSAYHRARKSEKSFNSEVGVPLTILGLPNAWSSLHGWFENILEGAYVVLFKHDYPEWLVLECGADRPGDLRALHWVRPHVVVYTRFPDVPVHVEYFDSPEAVIEEKLELKKALRAHGTLIVNADDPKMANLAVEEGQTVLSYGFSEAATVRGGTPEVRYEDKRPVGMTSAVTFQAEHAELTLDGTLGHHHVYPLLAALAVVVAEGHGFSASVPSLTGHATPPGRMRVLKGRDGMTLIDDSYNSSPSAVEAGLTTLGTLKTDGRIVVFLGDMMELGDFSVSAHEAVGTHVAEVAHVFVGVGVRMRSAVQKAKDAKGRCTRIEAVQNVEEAIALAREILFEGDTVYVKGSQSMRMEKLSASLLADPNTAPEFLVRQDTEWKKR